jgi:hypothetical protein
VPIANEHGERVDIFSDERRSGRGKNGMKKCKTRSGGRFFF